MTRGRAAGCMVGIVFGVTLCWSGMSSPDVIRGALLLEQSYLFLFFASAVVTSFVGVSVVRRFQSRAVISGGAIGWKAERPERRHVVGALLFGIGWGVADACPGPIATHVGQGIAWGLFTMAGVIGGVWLYLRRFAVETEPAADETTAAGRATVSAQPAGAAP
jgi:uncharacterized protein